MAMPRVKSKKPLEVERAVRERMFGFWCEGGRNFASTARHFNRAITTVRRMAAADDWLKRADDIDHKIRKRIDDRIVVNEVSNIRLVRTLKKKMAKQLFEKEDLDVNVRDFITLLQYEDKLMGNLPEGESSEGDSHYHINFGDLSDDERDRIRSEVGSLWHPASKRF